MQFDNTAFIVDRACCTILDSLRHIVDVNVITEHLTGAAIFGRNRRTGKADVCSIGQAVADNASRANNTFGDFFAILVSCDFDSLRKPVLPTVGLICHHDDIAALRKWLVGFLKLLHCGKDNPVCLSAGKQRLQMLSTFCVDRFLPQKFFAFGKLAVKLIVKVVAVGKHNDRGTVQGILQ